MEELDKENKNRQTVNLLQQEIDENRKQLHCLEVERSQMKIKLQQYEKEWQMSKTDLMQEKADLKLAQKNYAKLCKSKATLTKKLSAKDQARQKLKSELQQLHYNLSRMHNNHKIIRAEIIEKENELEQIDEENPINEIKQAMSAISVEICHAVNEVGNTKAKIRHAFQELKYLACQFVSYTSKCLTQLSDCFEEETYHICEPPAIETPLIPTYTSYHQQIPLEKEILNLCEKLRPYLEQLTMENSRVVPPCDSDNIVKRPSCIPVQEDVPPCPSKTVCDGAKTIESVEGYLEVNDDFSLEKMGTVPKCSSEWEKISEVKPCENKSQEFVHIETKENVVAPCEPSQTNIQSQAIKPIYWKSSENNYNTFKKCHASQYHVHSGASCHLCSKSCHTHSESHHVHPMPIYSNGSFASTEYSRSDSYSEPHNQFSQSQKQTTEQILASSFDSAVKPDTKTNCQSKCELPQKTCTTEKQEFEQRKSASEQGRSTSPLTHKHSKGKNEWPTMIGPEIILQANSKSYPVVSTRQQYLNVDKPPNPREKLKSNYKLIKESEKQKSSSPPQINQSSTNSNEQQSSSITSATDAEDSKETYVLIAKSRESKDDSEIR